MSYLFDYCYIIDGDLKSLKILHWLTVDIVAFQLKKESEILIEQGSIDLLCVIDVDLYLKDLVVSAFEVKRAPGVVGELVVWCVELACALNWFHHCRVEFPVTQ